MKSFNQFISESSKQLKFYVDMDGVLADFDKQIDKSIVGDKVKEIVEQVKAWMDVNYPTREWRSLHDISDLIEKHEDFANLYNEATTLIKGEARKSGFFRNLEVMEGAMDIINATIEVSGQLPTILTACIGSPYCEAEKAEWLKEHFSGMYQDVIFEQEKEKYANEYSVLVDDREKNVEDFNNAGGKSVHVYDNDPVRTVKLIKEFKV
jgi:5'(3')-deoxyribonucleotidase